MSWLKTIIGNSGDGIAKPIDAVGNALDKIFTSDEEKLSHAEIMEKLNQQPLIAQQLLNQANAASTNWFIAGGRPAIIWTCALGLFFFFIINPIIQWVTGLSGAPLPVDSIVNLTYGVLGLYGTQRTIEKITRKTK